jgi:hypothetical protein
MRPLRSCMRYIVVSLPFLFLWQSVKGAGWEQSDPEAVRAFESGNLARVKQVLNDPQRKYIEEKIYILADAYGRTIESGSIPVLEYLDSRGWFSRLQQSWAPNSNWMVQVAAGAGKNDVIDYLVLKHVDLMAADSNTGYTAMHTAVSFGQAQTVQHLCDLGVRADVRSTEGKTALELAEYELKTGQMDSPEATTKYKESLRQIIVDLKSEGPGGCVAKKSK